MYGISIYLIGSKNELIVLDINEEKNKINNKISPIKGEYIEEYLSSMPLDLIATTNFEYGLKNRDYIIIYTPTNYDEKTQKFDTSSVEML